MTARAGLVVALLAAGCGSKVHLGDSGGTGTTPTDTSVDWPAPTVRIASPSAPVTGPTVEVVVEVTDFALEPMLDETAMGWPGPLDWLVPAAWADLPGRPRGVVVLSLDGREVTRGPLLSFTLDGIEPGTYELSAELRWPDNHQFFPAADDSTTLVVE